MIMFDALGRPVSMANAAGTTALPQRLGVGVYVVRACQQAVRLTGQ